jgi:arginine utilization regulatory protein
VNPRPPSWIAGIRADLFYRLSGVQIRLPPLRERQADLGDLLDHYLHRLNRDLGRAVQGVSQEVLQLFRRYDWPSGSRSRARPRTTS